jgi:anti-sigma-K factor RskA
MPLTEDERLEFQERTMVAETRLKERQSFWETPRNIAILVGAVAAVVATVAVLAGYKAGSAPGPTIVFQPGSIVLQQPPAQK